MISEQAWKGINKTEREKMNTEKQAQISALERIGIDAFEARQMLPKMGRRAWENALQRGDIPHVRVGRKIVILKAPFLKKFGVSDAA